MDNILIIFLKYPKPGFVKTRLAASVGKEKAARVYREFSERIIRNTASEKYRTVLYFMDDTPIEDYARWLGSRFSLKAQKGNGLGNKMFNAFKDEFTLGAKKIVIIGTDSPFIDDKAICSAFERLEKKDVVDGPAFDGGYYLLGLKAPDKKIFSDINWSTDEVFEKTIKALKDLNKSYAVLEKMIDVDTIDDLKKINKIESSSLKI